MPSSRPSPKRSSKTMSGAVRPMNSSSSRGNAVTTGRSMTMKGKTLTAKSRYSDGGIYTDVTAKDQKTGKEKVLGGNYRLREADASTSMGRTRQASKSTGRVSKKVLGSYALNYYKKNSK